jgi:hypothetical protein
MARPKHIRTMTSVYTIINLHPKRRKGKHVVIRPDQPHKLHRLMAWIYIFACSLPVHYQTCATFSDGVCIVAHLPSLQVDNFSTGIHMHNRAKPGRNDQNNLQFCAYSVNGVINTGPPSSPKTWGLPVCAEDIMSSTSLRPQRRQGGGHEAGGGMPAGISLMNCLMPRQNLTPWPAPASKESPKHSASQQQIKQATEKNAAAAQLGRKQDGSKSRRRGGLNPGGGEVNPGWAGANPRRGGGGGIPASRAVDFKRRRLVARSRK